MSEEVLRLLAINAYKLYYATLCHGGSRYEGIGHNLRNPKMGDLVVETSTIFNRGVPEMHCIGRLENDTYEPMPRDEDWDEKVDGPLPTERIWYIRGFDGVLYRWYNASFIKVGESLTDVFAT